MPRDPATIIWISIVLFVIAVLDVRGQWRRGLKREAIATAAFYSLALTAMILARWRIHILHAGKGLARMFRWAVPTFLNPPK